MSSGPTVVRLARGGSSALDLDTEAGRAFLQERLAYYNKLCFFLWGGFFVVGAVLMAAGVAPPDTVSDAAVEEGGPVRGGQLRRPLRGGEAG